MIDLSKLKVSSSPHIRSEDTIRQIMLDVIIALMPALAISIFVFGWRSLVVTATTVAASVFFEWLYRAIMRKPTTIGDLSAVVSGMLLAFCLPASVPLWIAALGAFFAMVIVKQLYGGLAKNFVNAALAGRAFLLASFPAALTTWPAIRTTMPLFVTPDAVTAATPLAALSQGNMPDASLFDLALGMVGGSLGETSAFALLAGGLYLLYRRVISIHIPLAYIGTVAAFTFIFPQGHDPFEFMMTHLLSGGLMLGAFFMATDYSTAPINARGKIIYGIGCGLLTVFIRFFGAYPEGVSYAILVMNACVYLIERVTKKRKFGYVKPSKSSKSGGAK